MKLEQNPSSNESRTMAKAKLEQNPSSNEQNPSSNGSRTMAKAKLEQNPSSNGSRTMAKAKLEQNPFHFSSPSSETNCKIEREVPKILKKDGTCIKKGLKKNGDVGTSFPEKVHEKSLYDQELPIVSPDELNCKRTRSGRVCVPTLDKGSQKIVYDQDRSIVGISAISALSVGSFWHSICRK